MTRDWERALPTYIKLLRVLWAENRRALGSGNAFGKSAKGVRPQPLPSGGQASLKALVTPLPSAPPHDVGRIHPTQFSRHHVLADLTLSICRPALRYQPSLAAQMAWPQTASFAAFTGRTLSILRAGFALNTVGSLVNGLMPWRSLVAGFLTTMNLAKPGSRNSPDFFISW